MQMHANTLVFYANPCKYAYFLCKSMQIFQFFMQIHANTLDFYANPCKYTSFLCKYSSFLCKSMQILYFFMQIHANTLVFYANPCKYYRFYANMCKYCHLLCKYKRFLCKCIFCSKSSKYFKTQHSFPSCANAPGFGLIGAKYPFFAQIVKLLSKTDIFCIFVQMHSDLGSRVQWTLFLLKQ